MNAEQKARRRAKEICFAGHNFQTRVVSEQKENEITAALLEAYKEGRKGRKDETAKVAGNIDRLEEIKAILKEPWATEAASEDHPYIRDVGWLISEVESLRGLLADAQSLIGTSENTQQFTLYSEIAGLRQQLAAKDAAIKELQGHLPDNCQRGECGKEKEVTVGDVSAQATNFIVDRLERLADDSIRDDALIEIADFIGDLAKRAVHGAISQRDATICGLREALEGLGAKPDGYCFCLDKRNAVVKAGHTGECIQAQQALSFSPTCPHKEEKERADMLHDLLRLSQEEVARLAIRLATLIADDEKKRDLYALAQAELSSLRHADAKNHEIMADYAEEVTSLREVARAAASAPPIEDLRLSFSNYRQWLQRISKLTSSHKSKWGKVEKEEVMDGVLREQLAANMLPITPEEIDPLKERQIARKKVYKENGEGKKWLETYLVIEDIDLLFSFIESLQHHQFQDHKLLEDMASLVGTAPVICKGCGGEINPDYGKCRRCG